MFVLFLSKHVYGHVVINLIFKKSIDLFSFYLFSQIIFSHTSGTNASIAFLVCKMRRNVSE